jgi:hypothetical protein
MRAISCAASLDSGGNTSSTSSNSSATSGAALEKDLADLQRAVAVAPDSELPSRSAYSTSYSCRPASRCADLGQLGLAGAGRAVQQHVDAGSLRATALRSKAVSTWASSATKGEVGQCKVALGRGPGEHRHQFVRRAVLAHQHRRHCSLTFIRSARSVMLCSEIRFSTMPMRSSRARRAAPRPLRGVDARHRGDRGIGLVAHC